MSTKCDQWQLKLIILWIWIYWCNLLLTEIGFGWIAIYNAYPFALYIFIDEPNASIRIAKFFSLLITRNSIDYRSASACNFSSSSFFWKLLFSFRGCSVFDVESKYIPISIIQMKTQRVFHCLFSSFFVLPKYMKQI